MMIAAAAILIISSEVMEHVPQPLEPAFRNLHDALIFLLLMTTPFSLGKPHAEHFPFAPGVKLAPDKSPRG